MAMIGALGVLFGLFLAMLVTVGIGRRVGLGKKLDGLATIEGAVFGLLGLLLAFTFGSAAVRFETRRNLIVTEANDIGTAYLRIDLLPAAVQPKLRDEFRRYVETRLAIYKHIPNLDGAKAELDRMVQIQSSIWRDSVAACGELASPAPCQLLLPALNDMIDITTTRTVAFQTHQPAIIFVMLAISMLACALLAGFDMGGGHQSWLHVICFAAVLTIAFYVILDLEFPRIGLIRIDWMDRILADVRASMG